MLPVVRTIFRWLVLSFVCNAAWPAAPHAHAQSADEVVDEGLAARQAGDDARAAELFERAYAISPSPRVLAQWALAEQALARFVSAERRLSEVLDVPNDAWVERHRATLEDALATIRANLGDLSLECLVEGAEVLVDGVAVGITPLDAPLRLRAGSAQVELRKEGYLPMLRSLVIPSRGLARERFDLVAVPPPHASVARRSTSRSTLRETDRAGSGPTSVLTYVGFGALGFGVFAVAGGSVALGVREANITVWNDDARCNQRAGPGRDEECPNEASAWHTAETWAIVGFASAAVAAIAGTIALLLAMPSGESDHNAATAACAPEIDASRLGVACGGSF